MEGTPEKDRNGAASFAFPDRRWSLEARFFAVSIEFYFRRDRAGCQCLCGRRWFAYATFKRRIRAATLDGYRR